MRVNGAQWKGCGFSLRAASAAARRAVAGARPWARRAWNDCMNAVVASSGTGQKLVTMAEAPACRNPRARPKSSPPSVTLTLHDCDTDKHYPIAAIALLLDDGTLFALHNLSDTRTKKAAA